MNTNLYYSKYLKYKNKYLELSKKLSSQKAGYSADASAQMNAVISQQGGINFRGTLTFKDRRTGTMSVVTISSRDVPAGLWTYVVSDYDLMNQYCEGNVESDGSKSARTDGIWARTR
jgi:hypothetical protein